MAEFRNAYQRGDVGMVLANRQVFLLTKLRISSSTTRVPCRFLVLLASVAHYATPPFGRNCTCPRFYAALVECGQYDRLILGKNHFA